MDTSNLPTFSALWLNINGINSQNTDSNFYLLLKSFLKSDYQILFLQEPRLKDGKVDLLEKACNWPNSKVHGTVTSNSNGSSGGSQEVFFDYGGYHH